MEIPIRNIKKEVVAYAIVDEDDYGELNKRKWHLHHGYAACQDMETMHRKLTNAKKGDIVDHINHNKLDNRKCNLRIVTRSQNNQNRRKKEGTTSQYVGVFYDRNRKIFSAYSMSTNLGSYTNEEDAGRAHDIFAFHALGKGAKTNGLISYEEAMKISPPVKEKVIRDLPDNIYFENGKYYAQINYDGKRYKKFGFKTVEEAQQQLTQFVQEIEKIKEGKQTALNSRAITRTGDGIAFFTVKGVECLIDDDLWHEFSIKPVSIVNGRYLCTTHDGKPKLVHHIILPASANEVVDHINGNTFDNRRCNLRYASHSLNSQNRGKVVKENTTSIYKGVSLDDRHDNRIWAARCGINKKTVCIGTFYSEVEAARAYNQKVVEIYNNEARLNEFTVTRNDQGTPFLKIGKDEYLFDEENWHFVSELQLQRCENGFALYKSRDRLLFLHHLLYPPPNDFGVIHINGNNRDNRIINLKHVPLAELPVYPVPKSYLCVSRRQNNYVVRITYNGVRFNEGYYKSMQEAAIAYNQKAYQLFGSKAELNFIPY